MESKDNIEVEESRSDLESTTNDELKEMNLTDDKETIPTGIASEGSPVFTISKGSVLWYKERTSVFVRKSSIFKDVAFILDSLIFEDKTVVVCCVSEEKALAMKEYLDKQGFFNGDKLWVAFSKFECRKDMTIVMTDVMMDSEEIIDFQENKVIFMVKKNQVKQFTELCVELGKRGVKYISKYRGKDWFNEEY